MLHKVGVQLILYYKKKAKVENSIFFCNCRLFFFLSCFSLSGSVSLRTLSAQAVVELTFTPPVDKEGWQSEWGIEGVAGNSGAQARWINLKGMAL